MPDLLVPPKRRSRRRPVVEAAPSAANAKEIFAESQRIACSAEFAPNISRAVLQNVWQSEPATLCFDRDNVGAIVAMFVSRSEKCGETSVTATQITQRSVRHSVVRKIIRVLRDAQTQGKIEDINDFIEGWLAALTRPATESFINQAQHLEKRGQTDAALDIIFDQIDERLLAGEFTRVNDLLANISPEGLSVDLLLGILTATLPARRHLASRPRFFERVQDVLQMRGQLKEGLLVGLE